MDEHVLTDLYNLILNPATRDFERAHLLEAKQALENHQRPGAVLNKLVGALRPLGSRGNLTADVMDFYLIITGEKSRELAADETLDLAKYDRAIFAGGCFWCMVEPFDTQPGIIAVTSGYTGGTTMNPTYDQVMVGNTGHVEAVEIIYDAAIMSYQQLVDIFWQLTDPTDAEGQFLDRGTQYQSILFYLTEEQRDIAAASVEKVRQSGRYDKPIVTKVLPAQTFYPAENYHQDFYKKNPKRVKGLDRARRQLQLQQAFKMKVKHFFGR